MTVYFTRLKVGYPDPQVAPDDWEGSWRIYTVCTAKHPASSTTLIDVRALGTNDKADARSTYISFSNKARTGLNLKELYDEKQCHEAHSFKLNPHDNHEIKIHRIWGAGVIRLYFIYLPNKRIALLKTWAKRKNKLTKGEELILEELAKTVLECTQDVAFETREI